MPADFNKETPGGGLDTPHLIFKSHKTMYSDRYNSSFVFPSRFVFSLPQHMEGKNISQKNKSYARTHWGMRLMHDGATSLTARKTVYIRTASKQS